MLFLTDYVFDEGKNFQHPQRLLNIFHCRHFVWAGGFTMPYRHDSCNGSGVPTHSGPKLTTGPAQTTAIGKYHVTTID